MKSNDIRTGCGCLLFLIIILGFISTCRHAKSEMEMSQQQDTSRASCEDVINETKSTAVETDDTMSEEDKQYLGISLETGVRPYREYYGNGYDCPYSKCSGIRVTAPAESDIIVIIKRNNENGKVIQHGYIKKGETYQFDIPDGTYQTFFYYGMGWNANKPMKDGVLGGFVTDEMFSKDYPQKIESGILEYVLQLRRDGNFQTKQSDKSEMF